jgi:hypothetical protein
MPVLVWSRRFIANADLRRQAVEELGLQVMASAEKVAAHADVVSIHLALNKESSST